MREIAWDAVGPLKCVFKRKRGEALIGVKVLQMKCI